MGELSSHQGISQRVRSGFTLVELLVVITIIGILIGLLLPAVQAARESARKTTCQNDIRNLGQAVLHHEQAQGYFPTGGWGTGWVGDPDRGRSDQQPGGWIYNVLPYVEQSNLHDMGIGQASATKMSNAGLMVANAIAILNCPSRRQAVALPNSSTFKNTTPSAPSLVARSDYAINQGDAAFNGGVGPSSLTDTQYAWPNTTLVTGISYVRSQIKMAHITDGASQTLLAGEKFLNPDNYSTGADAGDKYCALGGWSYDNYRDASYKDSTGNALFMDIPSTTIPASCFGGPHSSGCQFVLCDGSVHNISFSVDLTTFRNLANRRDNQPIDDSKWR